MSDPPPLPPLVARLAHLVALLGGLPQLAGEPVLRAALSTCSEVLATEPPGTRSSGLDPAMDPAIRLGSALRLTPFEYDVVLLAGLPEEHEALAHLVRLLHPRHEAAITTGTVAAVLGLDATGRRYLRQAVEEGPLHRHGLVAGAEAVVLPERSLRLPLGLWSVLRGCDHWPTALRPLPLPRLAVAAPPARRGLAAAVTGGARLVMLTGEGRSDAELAAIAAGHLADAGPGAVLVAAADLDTGRTPAWSAHALARGAVPVVVGLPAAPPLPDHPAPVVVAASSASGLPLDDRPALAVDLPRPDLGDAVTMWHRLLPELDGTTARLAGLVRVGELDARRAVGDWRAAAPAPDAPAAPAGAALDAVVATVRRRTDVRLPPAVRAVRPRAGLGQVVLPEEQLRLLRSVVDRVRGQAAVLHDWGFARAARLQPGVRVLLSGPPGTGKSLAAEAVAGELGLDLLVVDLASLVSKWLGETEKNIAEVFDAAERCQAVLFFDEADAVFGRRTDASDAQARWANLETAYLLGRIDRTDGLVVLATNLRRNIDDAFLRRLDVVVELDEPDRAARERLWRQHLPARAPRTDDVDLGALAAMYEISGGLIRNAAVAAGFAAAASVRRIAQADLVEAVHDEYRKAGRSFPGARRAAARIPQPPPARQGGASHA